jgi:hypothetical protein
MIVNYVGEEAPVTKKKVKCKGCGKSIEVVFFEGEAMVPNIVGCDHCYKPYKDQGEEG